MPLLTKLLDKTIIKKGKYDQNEFTETLHQVPYLCSETPMDGSFVKEEMALPGANDNELFVFDGDLFDFIEYSDLGDHHFVSNTTESQPQCLPENTVNQPKLKQQQKFKMQWKQSDVMIQTLESEFKVTMWKKTYTEEDDIVNPTLVENEQYHIKPITNFCEETQNKINTMDCPINYCEVSYNNISALRNHLHHHYLDSKNDANDTTCINCPFTNCKKVFKSIPSLRKHLNIHGPRNNVCADCGKCFVEFSKLKRHWLVHSGDKPFKCTFAGCGKRFSLDFNLRTHTRIHTGNRPFKCSIEDCERSFSQSTNLKAHILTHFKKHRRQKSVK